MNLLVKQKEHGKNALIKLEILNILFIYQIDIKILKIIIIIISLTSTFSQD